MAASKTTESGVRRSRLARPVSPFRTSEGVGWSGAQHADIDLLVLLLTVALVLLLVVLLVPAS